MADTKGSDLPRNTSTTVDDLIIMVNDPAGTPATQAVAYKDFLPRYTTAAMNAIGAPEDGMLVWNTTLAEIFIYSGLATDWLSTRDYLPEA